MRIATSVPPKRWGGKWGALTIVISRCTSRTPEAVCGAAHLPISSGPESSHVPKPGCGRRRSGVTKHIERSGRSPDTALLNNLRFHVFFELKKNSRQISEKKSKFQCMWEGFSLKFQNVPRTTFRANWNFVIAPWFRWQWQWQRSRMDRKWWFKSMFRHY